MKNIYLEDYIEELAFYFPQIEEKELERMMRSSIQILNRYIRNWYRGFRVESTETLMNDGKKYKFEVARIYGKGHLKHRRNIMKKRNRNRNKLKNGKR